MYERFAELMKEKGVTAYKVSSDTGIAQSTLSDWKSGKITPKIDKLILLADYFDVDVEYLVGNSNVRKKEMSNEELQFVRQQGDMLYEHEINEALQTITKAINNRPKLTSQEQRLLTYFQMLSGDMQDRLLDLIEATAKDAPKRP